MFIEASSAQLQSVAVHHRGWLTGCDAVPAAPPDPKRWLLHPSLPVDVRLLGGLAALLGSYALFRQVRK